MTYYTKEYVYDFKFDYNDLIFILSECLKFGINIKTKHNNDYYELIVHIPYYNDYYSYFSSFFGYTKYIDIILVFYNFYDFKKIIFLIDIDKYDDKIVQWTTFQINYIIDCIEYYYKY